MDKILRLTLVSEAVKFNRKNAIDFVSLNSVEKTWFLHLTDHPSKTSKKQVK